MDRLDVKNIARTLAKSRPNYDGENDTPEWIQWCKTVDEFIKLFKFHNEFDRRFTEQDFLDLSSFTEACPGCGFKPGDGLNPRCYHPAGCGHWRSYEERTNQHDES